MRGVVPLRKDTNLSCRRRPVNDYPGLNSLMRRLANPGWDGLMKDIHTGYVFGKLCRGKRGAAERVSEGDGKGRGAGGLLTID